MSLLSRLQNPFGKRGGAPDTIEEYLETGGSGRSLAFNHCGTLLAVGCTGGLVVLWDFETRGAAKELEGGHAADAAVVCLAWSRTGFRLASGASDGTLLVWDVLTGQPVARTKVQGVPLTLQLHPRRDSLLLVSVTSEAAVLVDLEGGGVSALPCGTPSAAEEGAASVAPPPAATSSRRGGGQRSGCVALFAADGEEVLVGSAVGTLTRLRATDLAVLACVRVCSSSNAVRALACSSGGAEPVALCADRTLRALEAAAAPAWLQHGHSFRDSVGSANWHCCGVSADGETLAAGARGVSAAGARGGGHELHLWCRRVGALLCVLEGPADAGPAVALAWHPTDGGLLASLGQESGCVYLWARAAAENWSAFAPDFRELEENEEYVEREDEFDAAPAAHGASAEAVHPPPAALPAVDILTPLARPAAGETLEELRHLPLGPIMLS